MNDDEMVVLVKRVCSDVKTMSDFLVKMSSYIYLTSNSEEFNTTFMGIIKDKSLDGKFSFKIK